MFLPRWLWLTSAFFLISHLSKAQNSTNKEPTEDCLIARSLYVEHLKNGSYDLAYPFWQSALNQCNSAFLSNYVDGVKLLRHQIENTEDLKRKAVLLDSLMYLYESRIGAFGQEGFVRGRQGSDLLKYNPTAIEKAFNLLQQAHQLEGNKFESSAFIWYLKAATKKHQDRTITENSYFQILASAFNAVDTHRSVKKFNNYRIIEKHVGALLKKYASCNVLDNIYAPRIKTYPEELVILKQATVLYSAKKCNSAIADVAFQALINLGEGTNEILLNKASLLVSEGQCKKAIPIYKTVLEQTSASKGKTKIFLKLAQCYLVEAEYVQARRMAEKALEHTPQTASAYVIIGTAYAASRSQCPGKTRCDNRAVYWVAADMYEKAYKLDPSEATKKRIKACEEQYPSIEECFGATLKAESTYTVGCWINRETTVKVRRR